jgi:hypothetical protein
MVEFAALDELEIPELQPAVWMGVERLGQLARTFRDGQEVLESDRFAAGSHFIGVLLSIRHQVKKFTDQPAAVQQFEQQVLDSKLEYQTEYLAFLLMAFLNSSVQFIVGRTCSHEEYEAARRVLADLVRLEIGSNNTASDNQGEPGSDDFCTYVTASQSPILNSHQQIATYAQMRDAYVRPISFWFPPPPGLRQPSAIAIRILGLLTTSASVERVFSAARWLCADDHLAMKQETVNTRVVIQANSRLAESLLQEVLAMTSWAHSRILEAHARPDGQADWRLQIHTEEDRTE